MENEDEGPDLEAVFIAANIREIDTVEQIFTAEGIEYNVRPSAFRRGGLTFAGEFDGLLFEVLAGQAQYCRKLLIAKGFQSGVVLPESEARLDFPTP